MRILVLGTGAREHALTWKLKHEHHELFALPGNPGMATLATCVAGDPCDASQVTTTARAHQIDLVVVGPEAPLVAGVADALRAANVPVFGPSAAAAAIEGSKAFAKEVMHAANVPTAAFEVFDDAERAAMRAYDWAPVVVKADGLAAGKGVVVAEDGPQAAHACRTLGALPAGRQIVLEEVLTGPEVSVIALCDGEHFVMLPTAQDHKRIYDFDRGPNTGGMGAYAPANCLTSAQLDEVGRTVIAPTLAELRRRGTPFIGALFAGLMVTPAGPRVLEFNCRLGDPETQALLMLLDEPLAPILLACARGSLTARALAIRSGAAVGVVMAAEGYPESPRTGARITGLTGPFDAGVQVFQAGTKESADGLVTAGGRVLTVCAVASSFEEARARAYSAIERVSFEGAQFRRDIGAKAVV